MLPYSGMVMCSLVDQRRKQKKGRNPRNNINIKSLIKKSAIGNLKISGLREEKKSRQDGGRQN